MFDVPILTESWAAVYLEVVVAILVFGVGLPALILQTIVSDDIRRVAERHGLVRNRTSVVCICIALVAALLLVWLLHPYATTPGAPPQIPVRNLPWGDTERSVYYLANSLVTVVLFTAVVFWLLQISYRRSSLAGHIQKECRDYIRRTRDLAEVPPRSLLDDLVYLGQHGEPASERECVFAALRELAREVRNHQGYDGDGLDLLVQATERAVNQAQDIGTFRQGAEILASIVKGDENTVPEAGSTSRLRRGLDGIGNGLAWWWASMRYGRPSSGSPLVHQKRSDLSTSSDVAAALRALQRIGLLSLERGFEPVALSIVDTVASAAQEAAGLSTGASRLLFHMGTTALGSGRMTCAVQALNKLEALREQCADENSEETGNYLGLLAHFWAVGPAGQRYVRQGLAASGPRAGLTTWIKAAKEQHFLGARFDTVDKLTQMLDDLQRKPLSPPAAA